MIRAAASMSERLVFLTDALRERFRYVFHTTPLEVIPNPVKANDFAFSARTPAAGNRTLLYLGWIVAEKGVYDIVEAIPKVLAKYADVRFLFAGNKEVDLLRKRISVAGLDASAKVLGWVEGQKKQDLMINSRLLLLPTYTEGVPNVLLEAMAAGLPAITCPVGGVPSVFTEEVNGRFVMPGDVDGLAATIIELLDDDALCDRMSAATREVAVAKYDIDIVGRQLASLYAPYFYG